jgi:hypothetical protein
MSGDANSGLPSHRVLAEAIALLLAWALATWIFEGRIQTLLRPEATMDRLVYALGVNLALGVGGGFLLLRRWTRGGTALWGTPGTTEWRRTVVAVLAGLALGFGAYLLQGAPSTDPVVVVNAFAQVFVVSAAEVIVCWCLVAAAVEHSLARHGRVLAIGTAVLLAAALFGIYHFAHSPPFDTLPMVGLLRASAWRRGHSSSSAATSRARSRSTTSWARSAS